MPAEHPLDEYLLPMLPRECKLTPFFQIKGSLVGLIRPGHYGVPKIRVIWENRYSKEIFLRVSGPD